MIGLYAAASGLQAQQLRLDALANDVANINTAGYMRTRIAFRDLVYDGSDTVQRGSGVAAQAIGLGSGRGSLAPGNGPLSVAIEGTGYLQVRSSDGGVALTRSGELRVDAEGTVTLPSGERLEPRLAIPPGTDLRDVSIAPDGTVALRGETIGQIAIVDVPAVRGLISLGGNMFLPTEASGAPRPAPDAILRQGFVEQSNVDLGLALVQTLETQRSFEMVARALRMQEQLLEMANGLRR